jgi:hypothetical protein
LFDVFDPVTQRCRRCKYPDVPAVKRETACVVSPPEVRKVLEYLKSPDLYSPTEIQQKAASLIPPREGIYGWYFDTLPGATPADGCVNIVEPETMRTWTLLYVGSSENLYRRIATIHLVGKEKVLSTLRESLGAMLRTELRLQAHPRHDTYWFGEKGEQRLDRWLKKHAQVAWITARASEAVEDELIKGLVLPLNRRGNKTHPFYERLGELRKACRLEAQGMIGPD